MEKTFDWVKSLRADIRSDCEKGWNLNLWLAVGLSVQENPNPNN